MYLVAIFYLLTCLCIGYLDLYYYDVCKLIVSRGIHRQVQPGPLRSHSKHVRDCH